MNNNLQTVMTNIFTKGESRDLPAEYEPDLIRAAKAGNDIALVHLLQAYAPAIRSAYFTYLSVDVDERQSICITAFYEAIYAFDESKGARLAATLPYVLKEALSVAAASVNVFHVPARTLRRFFGILREASGDMRDAVALCTSRGMTRSTFLLISQAIQTPELLEMLTGMGDDERSNYMEANALSVTIPEAIDDEDAEILDVAFAAIDTDEEQIVRQAYGWETFGEPQTDEAVGEELGLGRMRVCRTRNAALQKMRVAVGLSLAA